MFNEEYQKLKNAVDISLEKYLPKAEDKAETLNQAMLYSLNSGGKRLRSVLIISFYQMASGKAFDAENILPFAVAAEYIQTYSLIHDDLPAMDNDDYRRGKLTNHKVFGEGIATLAGDALLSSASEIMLKTICKSTDYYDMKRKANAAAVLIKGTGVNGMVQGQLADLENEGKEQNLDMLNFIDDNKTGAFIYSAVLCGSILGNADASFIKSAEIYGKKLGKAFQICDDILDIIGDEKELGKMTGVDSIHGKNTYPALMGIDASKAAALELLNEAESAIKDYDYNGPATDLINYLRKSIN